MKALFSDSFCRKVARLYATWPEYIGVFFVDVLPSNPIGRWFLAGRQEREERLAAWEADHERRRQERWARILNLIAENENDKRH